MWKESSEIRGDLFIDVTAPRSADRHLRRRRVRRAPVGARARLRLAALRRRPARPLRHPRALPRRARRRGGLARGGVRAARRARQGDVHRDPHPRSQARRRDAAHRAAHRCRPTSARWAPSARRPTAASGSSRPAWQTRRQARISAPVGLDLGATNARETALSIMAELAAVRHGRDGGRLCQSKGKGRIHATPTRSAADAARQARRGVPPAPRAPGLRSTRTAGRST